MGLDMYLFGTKNFSVFTRDSVKPPLEKTFEFTSLINNHGLGERSNRLRYSVVKL